MDVRFRPPYRRPDHKVLYMSRTKRFHQLDRADRELVEHALSASGHAYAPYSGFAVGAAVRTRRPVKKKEIITGANLENASYPLGICAEVAAIAAANARGQFAIEAIAVIGHKFTSPEDATKIVRPCGRCRQVIFEASQISGVDINVLSCNATLTKIVKEPISKLLPDPFGPANLGLDKIWPSLRVNLAGTVSRLLADARARRRKR
jgi:cytidine deaminase